MHPNTGIVTDICVGVVMDTATDVASALPRAATLQSEPLSVMLTGNERLSSVIVHPLQTEPLTGTDAVDLLAGVIDPVIVQSLHVSTAPVYSWSWLVPVVVSEILCCRLGRLRRSWIVLGRRSLLRR